MRLVIIFEMRATMFPVSERALTKLLTLQGSMHRNWPDGFTVIIAPLGSYFNVNMTIPFRDDICGKYNLTHAITYTTINEVIRHINYYWKIYEQAKN